MKEQKVSKTAALHMLKNVTNEANVSNSHVLLRWYYWQTVKAIQSFMKLVCLNSVDRRDEIRMQTKMQLDIDIPKNKIQKCVTPIRNKFVTFKMRNFNSDKALHVFSVLLMTLWAEIA
jgi:hypothetical protein